MVGDNVLQRHLSMAASIPKRNRRPLRFRNQLQPPLVVVASINNGTSTSCTLNLSESMFGVPDLTGWEVTDGTPQPVTGAVLSPDGLLLDVSWDVALLGGTAEIDIPAYSEGLRTTMGGWLAPAVRNFTTS